LDLELSDIRKLKEAARAKEQSKVTLENAKDQEQSLRDPPAPNPQIHLSEPSWDDEVEAASRRHRQPSPAKSEASVQTIVENVSRADDEILVMICEHCRVKMDNGDNVVFLDGGEDTWPNERPSSENLE